MLIGLDDADGGECTLFGGSFSLFFCCQLCAIQSELSIVLFTNNLCYHVFGQGLQLETPKRNVVFSDH